MSVKNYEPTQDVQDSIAKFETLDAQFDAAYQEFYAKHTNEMDQINRLIEARNVALDEGIKMFRDEVDRLNETRFKTVDFHAFRASKKKGSDFFSAVDFDALAKQLKVAKSMEDEGVIQRKVEINFKAAQEFLKKNGLEAKFAKTLHEGDPLTTAVTAPKPVAFFGQKIKKS